VPLALAAVGSWMLLVTREWAALLGATSYAIVLVQAILIIVGVYPFWWRTVLLAVGWRCYPEPVCDRDPFLVVPMIRSMAAYVDGSARRVDDGASHGEVKAQRAWMRTILRPFAESKRSVSGSSIHVAGSVGGARFVPDEANAGLVAGAGAVAAAFTRDLDAFVFLPQRVRLRRRGRVLCQARRYTTGGISRVFDRALFAPALRLVVSFVRILRILRRARRREEAGGLVGGRCCYPGLLTLPHGEDPTTCERRLVWRSETPTGRRPKWQRPTL
jgi:hypothetical protein